MQAPAGSLSANSLADAAGDDSAALKLGSIDVPVLAVNNIIRRTSILDGLSSACRAHLRKSSKTIDGIDGESDVLGPLTDFAAKLGPQAKSSVGANAGGASGKASTAPAATASVSLFGADPADLSDEYQDVMHEARLSLTRNLGSSPDPSAGADSDATAIPSLEDFSQLEERVDASLEKLEDIVTSLLYDRLFAPPASRDLQEDENLASRIAALNVLELGLDHLGLELEDEEGLEGWEQQSRSARESLEDLAAAVGKRASLPASLPHGRGRLTPEVRRAESPGGRARVRAERQARHPRRVPQGLGRRAEQAAAGAAQEGARRRQELVV